MRETTPPPPWLEFGFTIESADEGDSCLSRCVSHVFEEVRVVREISDVRGRPLLGRVREACVGVGVSVI